MATKNLIPRGSGEGGIGITDTTWGQAYFDTGNFNKGLFVSGKNIQQVVSDVVAGGGLGGVWDSGPAGVIYYNGGNVGIGTTNPGEKLEISGTTAINPPVADSGLWFGTNNVVRGYIGGGDFAVNGLGAGEFGISSALGGSLVFGIHGTEKMRVDSSGNVGIGTTSPIGPLHVSNASENTISLTREANVLGTTNVASCKIEGGALANTSPSMGGAIGFSLLDSDGPGTGVNTEGYLYFETKASGSGLTERMRIDSTGNVGIGTTSPTGLLEIRKDEDRNPATAHLKIMGGSGLNGNQAVTGSLYIDNGGPTNTVAKFYISQDITGGEVRIVSVSNGVRLLDGATSWATISDIALKENISPLENVLDKIKDYRCVEYNLKESPEDKKIGFIAQDWVDDFNPIVHKDEEGLLGMKYTETIPVLLKAIQEQQQLIEDLKSRVKTLESK